MTGPAGPVPWPEGKRAAAAFTFDVDGESAVLWGSPQTADRMSVISHQAYGPLVGVPRLKSIDRPLGQYASVTTDSTPPNHPLPVGHNRVEGSDRPSGSSGRRG